MRLHCNSEQPSSLVSKDKFQPVSCLTLDQSLASLTTCTLISLISSETFSFFAAASNVQPDISGAFVSYKTFTNIHTYLWTEVDDPVELYYHAGLALLETELAVIDAGARSQ